jgi:hypothetical protein
LDELLRTATEHGPLVSLELADDELDDFRSAFEGTAKGAQNMIAMERLCTAFTRIEAGFVGETDLALSLRTRGDLIDRLAA